MTVANTRIKDLVKLTKGRSKTDRTLLYRHIAHLIIQRYHGLVSQEKSLEDTKILFELFDALSSQVDEEIRIELAQDLRRRENPPEELTKRLAKDKISIAEPVLRSAPFKEKTLLDIINNTKKAHHLIIAERKDLSQKLWQAIVDSREGGKQTKVTESQTKKEIETETPLIQFPRRAVDLFVPSNDKTPQKIVAPTTKDMPPIPSFFLGKPPERTNADASQFSAKKPITPISPEQQKPIS